MSYAALCQTVQGSAFPDAYQQWFTEADRIVTMYGVPGGDEGRPADVAAVNNQSSLTWQQQETIQYQFTRGFPEQNKAGRTIWKPETSWDCMGRLADEVNIRAFETEGTVYFVSEPDLFMSAPVMDIAETDQGIDKILYDYDIGKMGATVTIETRASRWSAPPGSVVTVHDVSSVVDGRWLISEIERDIFDTGARITAKKPRPVLPEPTQQETERQWSLQNPWTGAPEGGTAKGLPPTVGQLPEADGTREAIVDVATRAWQEQQKNRYHYLQKRPYPRELFSAEAHAGIDCSAFVHMVYRQAGAPDPSNFGFNGQGNTGSLSRSSVLMRVAPASTSDLENSVSRSVPRRAFSSSTTTTAAICMASSASLPTGCLVERTRSSERLR
jgi:hypothetical protein